MESHVISLRPEYCVTIEHAEKLLRQKREILEQIALGVDYSQILDVLYKAAERMIRDALASILVYDETGESVLSVLAAPSIPPCDSRFKWHDTR